MVAWTRRRGGGPRMRWARLRPTCTALGLAMLQVCPAAHAQLVPEPPGAVRSGERATGERATADRATAPERVTSPFYRELSQPGTRRAAQLLEQAKWHRELANQQMQGDWESACRQAQALAAHMDHEANRHASMRNLRELATKALLRRARLDNALARLERALALEPGNHAAAFERAETLRSWEEPGPLWECKARRRTDEAIAAYRRLATVAPGYRAAIVAAELGLLYTRKHAFRDAVAAHMRALTLSLDTRATTLTNLAEVTMLAGDLEGALTRYRRALTHAQDAAERALALWGMAITFDRLGEHDAAIAEATKALQVEGGYMRVLHAPGVFFEPRRELLYYEALGYEAQAALAPQEGAFALGEAVRTWQEYLARAPDHDPFIENARANLARVIDQLRVTSRRASAQDLAGTGTGAVARSRGRSPEPGPGP